MEKARIEIELEFDERTTDMDVLTAEVIRTLLISYPKIFWKIAMLKIEETDHEAV